MGLLLYFQINYFGLELVRLFWISQSNQLITKLCPQEFVSDHVIDQPMKQLEQKVNSLLYRLEAGAIDHGENDRVNKLNMYASYREEENMQS